MIIPRFYLSQDEKTLTINIRAPYCKFTEADLSVEENVFIFYCRPYHLRLNLPGKIEHNESTKSSFNSDNGEFTFQLDKVNSGEHFEDLEFITKLLQTKVDVEEGNRNIEVLSNDDVFVDTDVVETVDCAKFGFGMRGGYNFKVLSHDFSELFEIDPEKVELEERSKLRHQIEQEQFDVDYYLGDIVECSEIDEILKLSPPWETMSDSSFTSNELDFMKDLPNIAYNLSDKQVTYCHNSLLEIMFAYCYDRRTTYFEGTCESGWTIAKLSSSLCWFDGFLTPKQALINSFRRSLIYPLYRNFKLSQQIFNDLKKLINLGEQYIIKCLIEIYNIFLNDYKGFYVLNNLFMKDYIVYLMKWDKSKWKKTVDELNSIVIEKKDLGLNLINYEELLDKNSDLNEKFSNLNLSKDGATDSDDESDCTESDDESDDTESEEESDGTKSGDESDDSTDGDRVCIV